MEKPLLKTYKTEFKRRVILVIIGIALGILLFFLPLGNIVKVMTIILGVLLLISGVIKIIMGTSGYGRILCMNGIIQAIMGLFLIIFPGGMLNIIFASILIVLPIIRIILANDKKEAFKDELFTLVLGIVILFFGINQTLDVVRYILGSLVIIYALYNLYLAYQDYHKAKEEDNVLDAKIKEIK